MPTSELKRLYGYARMIQNKLKDEQDSDLSFLQARWAANQLTTWLEEAIWIKENPDPEPDQLHGGYIGE